MRRRCRFEIPGRLAFLGNYKVGERSTDIDSNHVHGQLLSQNFFLLDIPGFHVVWQAKCVLANQFQRIKPTKGMHRAGPDIPVVPL